MASPAASSSHASHSAFSFPAAFQPSIIRSFQKDTYYLSLLQSQLSDVVRSLLGSRFLQVNAQRVSLLAAVAYYATTTWEGAQTLGEEYVGSRMVAAGGTGSRRGPRFVSKQRRMAFILAYIVAPYVLSRLYARLRRAINTSNSMRSQTLQRKALRWRATGAAGKEPKPSRIDRLMAWLSQTLPSVEDLKKADGWISIATTVHLMLFYLGSRYYKVAQRIAGVRYISIDPAPPGQEPPSYEVLGFLLAVQLGVKLATSLNHYLHKHSASQGDKTGQDTSDSSRDEATVDIDGRPWTHRSGPARPVDSQRGSASHGDEGNAASADFADLEPDGPKVPLAYASSTGRLLPRRSSDGANSSSADEDLSTAQLRAASVESFSQSILKCTLCMDDRKPELGTSAVTECGHVFDWGCIMNWLKEKNECPLCRQAVRANRVLPIYNI
ncbi:unnamed protein product [Parajaminaea phylloscopi]